MEDVCYSCKSENIDYTGDIEWEADFEQQGRLYICGDCDAEGTMYYDVQFKFAENFGE